MKINPKALISSIFRQARSTLLDDINDRAREKFDNAFNNLIERIEAHPVSQELNQKQASDSSQFLSVKGNLFSFLGFQASRNPVDELITFLNQTVSFIPAKNITVRGLLGVGSARAVYPSRSDFDILGLSWEPGRSWVYAIEEGVNNLGYYLFIISSKSRSGKGIQAPHEIRAAQFEPTPYITPILEAFKKELS